MAKLDLICSVVFDAPIIDKFLAYYRNQGVSRFIVVLHREEARAALEQRLIGYNHSVVPGYAGPFTPVIDADFHNQQRALVEDWYVIADVDEFHRSPNFPTLLQLCAACKAEGSTMVHSRFFDRLTVDGTIPESLEGSLDEQFPCATNVTAKIVQGAWTKIAIARADMPISEGHHWGCESGVASAYECETHHFKWYGKHLIPWLIQRKKIDAEQGRKCWAEQQHVLDHLAKHGRFDLSQLNRRAARIGV